MIECPLGYTCELMCNQYIDDEGNFRCENDEACEQFGLSWNLPYEYDEDEKILTVTNDPVSFHWQKEIGKSPKFESHCHINGMQAGFYYRAMSIDTEEIIDYRQIIRREWQKTGWSAASIIPKNV